jgi:hypothetical protein
MTLSHQQNAFNFTNALLALGRKLLRTERITILVSMSLLFMAGLLTYWIPPDNDEFIQYHALVCWLYPKEWLEVNPNVCGFYDMYLLGFIPWQRAYNYIGATYSLLYYPIYSLWPHWLSTRVLDSLITLVGVVAAARLLKIRMSISLLCLWAIFPIFFFTIHNYGALSIQLSALYLVPLLAYKTVQITDKKLWLRFNILTGFVLAMSIESKPVLLYYVPSISVLTLFACWHLQPGIKSIFYFLIKRLYPAILLSAALMLVFLTASIAVYGWKDDDFTIDRYISYYEALITMDVKPTTVSEKLNHLWKLVAQTWLNFCNSSGYINGFTQMNFSTGDVDWFGFKLTLPFWGCLLWLIVLHIYYSKRIVCPQQKNILIGLFLSAILGLIAIANSTSTWMPHHVLPPFYFLLGAMALMLQTASNHSKRQFIAIVAILLSSQVACAYYTAMKPKAIHIHAWERLDALKFIRDYELSERTVVNNLTWGTYYLSSLNVSNGQLDLAEHRAWVILRAANKMGRGVTYIQCCIAGGFPLPSDALAIPLMRRVFMADTHAPWEVWTSVDPDPENFPIITDGRAGMAVQPENKYKSKTRRAPSFLPYDMPYNFQRLLPLVRPAHKRVEYYNDISSRIRLLSSTKCPNDDNKRVQTWTTSPWRKICQ